MHKEILTKEQLKLLEFISLFKREYYLVGGTAIALHIGHRKSIDFDLFKFSALRTSDIRLKLNSCKIKYNNTFSAYNQFDLLIHGVKFTFFSYPYKIVPNSELKGIIKIPDLLTLAAMKAFALGRRAKWKNYVDLFFILKNYYSVNQISEKAKEIFGELFIEKQFRAQLGYYVDVNYSEEVIYIIPNPPKDDEIKAFLIDVSLTM